jgi:hypothetical protein
MFIIYLAMVPIGLSMLSRLIPIDPESVEAERQAYYNSK